jgi:hypothetical protein
MYLHNNNNNNNIIIYQCALFVENVADFGEPNGSTSELNKVC